MFCELYNTAYQRIMFTKQYFKYTLIFNCFTPFYFPDIWHPLNERLMDTPKNRLYSIVYQQITPHFYTTLTLLFPITYSQYKRKYYFCISFNILYILNYTPQKAYYETEWKAEKKSKKESEKICEKAVKDNGSKAKGEVGRPHCGIILGVLPEYREEVEEQFIRWYEMGYFHKEPPIGKKALADFLYRSQMLLSNDRKPLSARTIEQELGGVWRYMHPKNDEEKKKGKDNKRKKKKHKN